MKVASSHGGLVDLYLQVRVAGTDENFHRLLEQITVGYGLPASDKPWREAVRAGASHSETWTMRQLDDSKVKKTQTSPSTGSYWINHSQNAACRRKEVRKNGTLAKNADLLPLS